MQKVRLGKEGAEFVALDVNSGEKYYAGKRKPSQKLCMAGLRIKPALGEEVIFEDLTDD